MSDCIRTIENISSYPLEFRLDHSSFEKENFKDNLPIIAPKIDQLLKNITALDEKDKKDHGKLFKHMIFSDLKSEGGAKTVGGAFLAHNFTLIYDKNLRFIPKLPPSDKNFAILCSTKLYGKDVGVRFRRSVLDVFNKRPDNTYGEKCRFIILDYGFKEGIDLFDIKYIHILETPITRADEQQVIGRGTRFCGQKGLEFHKTEGWPLYVFKYKSVLPPRLKDQYQADSLFELFVRNSNIDRTVDEFAKNLDRICIQGSIDLQPNKNMHIANQEFKELYSEVQNKYAKYFVLQKDKVFEKDRQTNKINCLAGCKGDIMNVPTEVMLIAWYCLMPKVEYIYEKRPRSTLCKNLQTNKVYCTKFNSMFPDFKEYVATNEKMLLDALKKVNNASSLIKDQKADILAYIEKAKQTLEYPPEPPKKMMPYYEMQAFMMSHYKKYTWPEIKLENQCLDKKQVSVKTEKTVNFTPTQLALQTYFQPVNPYKGLLLWHGTGVGKTCTGISVATNSFEKEGYTILWVTRNTLVGDIWKNMFKDICSKTLTKKEFNLEDALKKPQDYISDRWMLPITYKQFSNLLLGKNKLYEEMVARNGKEDPLKKTLLIIDEAHKLLSKDLKPQEKPDFSVLKKFILDSYEKSKKDSVRVMLMTATPYSEHPSQLIKLLNLLRTPDNQLVEDFDIFKVHYLDEQGRFKYPIEFLNQISGYISYLNRSADARQFSQPQVSYIEVPISQSNEQFKVQLEEQINQAKLDIAANTEEKKKAKEKIKWEKKNLLQNCKQIPDPIEREKCKLDVEVKAIQFEKELFAEADAIIKDREEKMKRWKKEFKTKIENDMSQEKALAEKCIRA